MYRIILLLACLVAACTGSDRDQRRYLPQADIWQTVSHDTEVFRDGADHILARTVILERHNQMAFYLSLSILRGGPNGPKVLRMTENERPLAYQRHDRLLLHCIDHCHKAEIGAITLDQRSFAKAAAQGMIIAIDGQRRNYVAHVPAQIFAAAWNAVVADQAHDGHALRIP